MEGEIPQLLKLKKSVSFIELSKVLGVLVNSWSIMECWDVGRSEVGQDIDSGCWIWYPTVLERWLPI